jgi:hypothetical protein
MRNTFTSILKRFCIGALLVSIPLQGGCGGNTITWQEEVKLNDGRVIIVTQKRRCEGAYTGQNYAKCISRETWLTIKLPEFGNKEIVWNEKLEPMVVNLYQQKLYVIGVFPTGYEFDLYGKPRPPYIGFQWDGNNWHRLSFNEIPEAIYDGNMVIDLPPEGTTLLTVEKKNSREMNGNRGHPKSSRRIDPTFTSNY